MAQKSGDKRGTTEKTAGAGKLRVAYHESGHAVVAFLLRRRCEYVTIIPDEGRVGHVCPADLPDSFRPETDTDSLTRYRIEREAKIFLGGITAERMFTGRQVSSGSEHDLRAAAGLAQYLSGTDEEASAQLKLLLIQTQNLLSAEGNWCAVQRLADALMRERRIPWSRVRQIIEQALNESLSNDSLAD
ncbi:MAG: hypothetical protein NTX23_05315 [Candidatus Bipolaricaulota bacterium]|nr:hypothetical protein [Candidatus Bipolaricaulota bacterium]